MPLEGVRAPDVADHRPSIPVPALIHDAGEIRAALSYGRDVTSPERVRPERRGIEPGRGSIPLHDVSDSLGGEAGWQG